MKAILRFTPLLLLLLTSVQHSYAQRICLQQGDTLDKHAGVQDGYYYELWSQNAEGMGCITLGEGALFRGEWENVFNYLARRGLKFDETQLHDEIGTFYTEFNCLYEPSKRRGGNSYLGVYGWTVDPLVEYYIIEDWQNWIPSMAHGATLIDTLYVNDGVYDIYQNIRVNQPSIVGDTTFPQYFSIRRDTRISGKVNITDHFNKWESLELEMGKMYEVSFLVEGYKSSGRFEFFNLDVYTKDESIKKGQISDTKLEGE